MNGILQQPPPFLSKDECDLLKRTILKGYPDDEQEMFIRLCQRTRLDPFTKQIYATKRYQKVKEADGSAKKVPTLVPVTGIIGLTAVADRTGHYDGCEIFWSGPEGEWKTEWLEEENPAAAKCIVYHKHRRPEVAIARWFSYVGQVWDTDKRQWVVTDFWDKMPDYMLGKVAKAAALRGAFPDPLGNVYIREELESSITDTETETLPSDEARAEEIQRGEAEAIERLKSATGVKFVESRGPKPTPQEALEPAFEEDKIPEKSPSPPRKAANIQNKPAMPTQSPAAAAAQPPDDLDMGEEPSPAQPGPPAQQEHGGPPAGSGEVAAPWKEHVILGVNHVKFHKRKVGELNAAELAIIEGQWLPAVREQWDDATDAQRADAAAFEAAISYSKMAKPW